MKRLLEYMAIGLAAATLYSCASAKPDKMHRPPDQMPKNENALPQNRQDLDTIYIRIKPSEEPYEVIGPKEHIEKIRILYRRKENKRERLEEMIRRYPPSIYDRYNLKIPYNSHDKNDII